MSSTVRFIKRFLRALEYSVALVVIQIRAALELPAVLGETRPRFERDLEIRPATGSNYAVVVKFFGSGIDWSNDALLRALAAQGVNTVIVFNGTPSDAAIAAVSPFVQRILVRKNIGRDFGAYRAGYLRLLELGIRPGRLLFFNDSVFYLPGVSLDRMIRDLLTSDYDVVGSFENHPRHYHLGSYVFSLRGDVVTDPALQHFWRRYYPFSIRQHAIIRGEVKLSKTLLNRGYGFQSLFSLDKLAERLRQMSIPQLLGLLPNLPRTVRYAPDRLQPGAGLRKSLGRMQLPRSDSPSAIADLQREMLIDAILKPIEEESQVHWGFGIYYTVMHAPFVKKDLLRHGHFSEQDMSRILDDIGPLIKERLLRDMIVRQRPIRLSVIEHFRRRNGLD